jgi:hypothetical protein
VRLNRSPDARAVRPEAPAQQKDPLPSAAFRSISAEVGGMNTDEPVERAYRSFAPLYDAVYVAVFEQGEAPTPAERVGAGEG